MAPDRRTSWYDIHGMLKVRLTVARCTAWRARLLEAKFSALAGVPFDRPDIDVGIGPFRPDIPPDARIIDKDFHVADGYIHFRGIRGRGATEIVGLNGGPTVLRHCPYAEGPLSRLAAGLRGLNMYLEPLVAWQLRQRGVLMLHAAAVARDGRAVVLAGTNGAFKTRLALDLCLRRGWTLLGDDLVLLHQAGVLSFVEHPAVLHARARAVLAGGPPRAGRLRTAWAVARGRWRPADALRLADSARLAAFVLLERTDATGNAQVSPFSLAEAWKRTAALERLELNKHHRRHRQVVNFGRFLMAHEYACPGSDIFAAMLLDDPPLPAAEDLPTWRCLVGSRYDPALPQRLEQVLAPALAGQAGPAGPPQTPQRL